MKNVLLTILFISLSLNINAALIRSIGSGWWNLPTTWDLGRTPQDGDQIVIESGHDVNIISNVEIEVNGNMLMGDGILSGRLLLDTQSSIVVMPGGSIASDSWRGNLRIVISDNPFANPPNTDWDTNQEWAAGDAPITGPATVTDDNISGSLPPGYWPLPVEFISFSAVQVNEQIKLEWQTATEENNDFFTVEYSLNGIDFNEVANEKGAGNSQVVNTYHYYYIPKLSGIYYYRIKQTDYNGDFSYSEIISVNYNADYSKDCDIKLEGNEIIIDYGYFNAIVYLKIYNNSGNILVDKIFNKTSRIRHNISSLPNGVMIIVTGNSLGYKKTSKFFIE